MIGFLWYATAAWSFDGESEMPPIRRDWFFGLMPAAIFFVIPLSLEVATWQIR
jgi:hypothetical protein